MILIHRMVYCINMILANDANEILEKNKVSS